MDDAATIPDEQVVVVEFPGIVRDTGKATSMIGGVEAIAQVSQGETQNLELRWRPDDPFCHPVVGNVVSTSNLVLRVRRTEGKAEPQLDLIGAATTTCRFRGMHQPRLARVLLTMAAAMADFQFVPDSSLYEVQLRNKIARMDGMFVCFVCASYRFVLVEQLARVDVIGDSRDAEARPQVPSLPPPIFSRVDLPSDYEFRQNPAVAAVDNSSRLALDAQLPMVNESSQLLLNIAKLRRCVAYGTDFNASNIRSYFNLYVN